MFFHDKWRSNDRLNTPGPLASLHVRVAYMEVPAIAFWGTFGQYHCWTLSTSVDSFAIFTVIDMHVFGSAAKSAVENRSRHKRPVHERRMLWIDSFLPLKHTKRKDLRMPKHGQLAWPQNSLLHCHRYESTWIYPHEGRNFFLGRISKDKDSRASISFHCQLREA